MLVLSREPGEAIIITTPDGYTIRILVSDYQRNRKRVSLAIEADEAVKIWREELMGEKAAT